MDVAEPVAASQSVHPPASRRVAAWRYALRTANPPAGRIDAVTRWLVVTRAAVLPMTLFAGAVAALLAVRQPGLSVVDLVVAIAGITLAHVANNLMNDVFDTQAGTDSESYPRALYAPHPILSGLVTRTQLLGAILLVNLAGLGILVYLATQRGWPIVGFALGGFLLSLAYAAPPLRLKRIGLGEPDVFVVWGPLMVAGTYYAATGSAPWQAWAASVPYGLLCTTVLMGKHIDKIPYDAPAGMRTLPVLLGERRARTVTRWLLAAFYVTVAADVAVRALPWPALLVVAAAPAAVRMWRSLRRPRPKAPPRRFPVWPLWFAAIAFLHTRRAGALLVLGLAIAAALDIR
jgi:1,4-dihydroxy-2-naphthoate octaprenyltransferase